MLVSALYDGYAWTYFCMGCTIYIFWNKKAPIQKHQSKII